MKRLSSILVAVLLYGTAASPLRAGVEVSVDFFHENLESYGDWREVGDYGYCWQPRDVDRDWRPYSDGRWLYTDAGWTWDSEEPYSWAVYHYGRWTRVESVGWVWVPGTEWGPAWVSWRRSPRHVGWAPLPPEAQFNRSSGFSSHVDVEFDIGPTSYSFVEVRNFGAPRLRSVLVEPRRNLTIINETTNITNVTYVNNVVYNQGPRYEVISRETAQPIRRLKLDRQTELQGDARTLQAAQFKTRIEGDSVKVVAPPIAATAATAPKKVAAKVEAPQIDHGWKNAGPAEEVAKVRGKVKTEKAPAETGAAKTEGATGETPGAEAPAAKTEKPEATPNTAVPPAKPGKPGKGNKGGKTAPVDPAPSTETAPGTEVKEPSTAPVPEAKPGKEKKAQPKNRPEPKDPATMPATQAERPEDPAEAPKKPGKGGSKKAPEPQPREASPQAQSPEPAAAKPERDQPRSMPAEPRHQDAPKAHGYKPEAKPHHQEAAAPQHAPERHEAPPQPKADAAHKPAPPQPPQNHQNHQPPQNQNQNPHNGEKGKGKEKDKKDGQPEQGR